MVANSNHFYFDYKDGKYGFNTDSSRGADTFFPFNNGDLKECLVGNGGAIMFMVKDDYSMLYTNGTSDLIGQYLKCDYVSGYHANIYAVQDCTVAYKHGDNAIVEKNYSANDLIVTVNYPSGNFCAFVK